MVHSGKLFAVVEAESQWEAWDTFKDEDAYSFGLIAQAEPDESGDPIPVQTETLMRRWNRLLEAQLFHDAAVGRGLI